MKREPASIVSKLQKFEQKQLCMDIAGDLLGAYGYDIEIKGQSSQWKHAEESSPKKVRLI